MFKKNKDIEVKPQKKKSTNNTNWIKQGIIAWAITVLLAVLFFAYLVS